MAELWADQQNVVVVHGMYQQYQVQYMSLDPPPLLPIAYFQRYIEMFADNTDLVIPLPLSRWKYNRSIRYLVFVMAVTN